jgi:hypothetical protein
MVKAAPTFVIKKFSTVLLKSVWKRTASDANSPINIELHALCTKMKHIFTNLRETPPLTVWSGRNLLCKKIFRRKVNRCVPSRRNRKSGIGVAPGIAMVAGLYFVILNEVKNLSPALTQGKVRIPLRSEPQKEAGFSV